MMNTSIIWLCACAMAIGSVFGCRTDDDVIAAPTGRDAAVAPQDPQREPGAAAAATPRVSDVPAARAAEPVVWAVDAVPQDPQRPEPPAFLPNAFPPIVPDTEWHQDAWMQQSCLRCHETGVGDAPQLVHRDLPDVLLTAKCRTCHVFVPGAAPRAKPAASPITDEGFARNAFPPMIPASDYHLGAWSRTDCLLCHENGVKGAPAIVHEGMPSVLLRSKCRTCHVQVRVVEANAQQR